MYVPQTTRNVTGHFLDKNLFVAPGTIIVEQASGALWSTVGSGLSVCIWNRLGLAGGMNHFLFPQTKDLQNATALFGNAAMYALHAMLTTRSAIPSFEATIIGGAFSDEFEEENSLQLIEVAEKYLWKENIPVIQKVTGGSSIRNIVFNVNTGCCVIC